MEPCVEPSQGPGLVSTKSSVPLAFRKGQTHPVHIEG
jgi:hypothetical protein